ncbi:MAG: hypothetical protein L3J23_02175 [Flavobacteriaceae bacterium]|nr:hypothetical protein [Flavobacteriaceae bacterium]
MYLNRIILVFIMILSVSCKDIFLKEEKNTLHQILNEEEIDYNSIDAYPLLPECKKHTNRVQQKECFYQKLTSRIQNSLDTNSLELSNNITGDIMVIIKVSAVGKATVESIIFSDKESLPKLDSLIYASIIKLPILEPAIKLGIPVNSEFLLPIIIN